MGNQPIPPRRMGHRPPQALGPPPDRESFHLGRARAAYVEGRIELERFELLAAHVLRGGCLTQDLQMVSEATYRHAKPYMPPDNPGNRETR